MAPTETWGTERAATLWRVMDPDRTTVDPDRVSIRRRPVRTVRAAMTVSAHALISERMHRDAAAFLAVLSVTTSTTAAAVGVDTLLPLARRAGQETYPCG